MIRRRRFPRIFFGWWAVLTGGFLCLMGYGYREYGFSALFKPIASELGFSRAITSTAASIGRFEGGLEAPVAGWVTDRFGPKGIVLFGIFLISLSLILMNYVNSLWAFLVVWGVMLGTGTNITLAIPLDTAISNWFVKKRGLALSIKHVFSGLSGVLVLPFIAWLIVTQGWRVTCVVGGLIVGLVGFPLAWFSLRRHRPEYYGLLPDGTAAEEETGDTGQMIDKGVEYAAEVYEVEFTLRQAMKTTAFWMLIVAHACHSLVAPTISIHLIPFLTDIGVDPLQAAGMMALMVGISIPSRLISGFLADRVGKGRLRFLLSGAYLFEAAGMTVFLLNQTLGAVYVWFVLYGIGMGAAWMLNAPFRARYFGRKAFGSIGGFSVLIMTPVGIAAPIYLGWVYDTTGSYLSAFAIFAGLLGLAAFLAAFILPPKPPAQITDIRKIA